MVAVDGSVPEKGLNDEIEKQMAPFDENGAGMFADGTRWDWWCVGGRWSGLLAGKDIARVKDLKGEAIRNDIKKKRAKHWDRAQEEVKKEKLNADHLDFMYGIKADDTKESYVNRGLPEPDAAPSCHAFLQDGCWNEQERLGWFGGTVKSECEMKAPEGVRVKSCVYSADNGASIKVWGGDDDAWSDGFHERFVKPLDPNTWLIVVDYHV
jgi:hypothetical protein